MLRITPPVGGIHPVFSQPLTTLRCMRRMVIEVFSHLQWQCYSISALNPASGLRSTTQRGFKTQAIRLRKRSVIGREESPPASGLPAPIEQLSQFSHWHISLAMQADGS